MRIEKIKRIVLIVMLLNFTIIYSVPVQGPEEPPDCDLPCDDDQAPENPIDGGLSLLIVAGTAYGIYESRKRK